MAEQGRVVRLPVHILDTMKRIQAVRSSLAQQQGRASGLVTNEEVARVLCIPVSKVAFYERVRAWSPCPSVNPPDCCGSPAAAEDQHGGWLAAVCPCRGLLCLMSVLKCL